MGTKRTVIISRYSWSNSNFLAIKVHFFFFYNGGLWVMGRGMQGWWWWGGEMRRGTRASKTEHLLFLLLNSTEGIIFMFGVLFATNKLCQHWESRINSILKWSVNLLVFNLTGKPNRILNHMFKRKHLNVYEGIWEQIPEGLLQWHKQESNKCLLLKQNDACQLNRRKTNALQL